ncbi:MAG TPA: hypothetical protein VEN78_37835 [Bradyrhizobium sp.]|nr:hypothetical protein [Bradyrhizobium sp.]
MQRPTRFDLVINLKTAPVSACGPTCCFRHPESAEASRREASRGLTEAFAGGGCPRPGSRRTSGPVRKLPRQRTSYPLIETAKLNEIDRLGSPMGSNGSCRRDRRHLVHAPNAAGCVLRSP